METENQTEETQVDESQLNSAAGDEAESVATDSLTLAEINSLTGKTYKDKESALKSIKDMSSQAGKAADLEGKLAKANESKPEEQLNSLQTQLSQLQNDAFFKDNQDYSDNRELIEKIAKADGISNAEVVETELYKSVSGTVASQSKRTVASSNGRVAQSSASKEFDPKGKSPDELAAFVTETYFKK